MIEIIIVSFLASANAKIALGKHQSPIKFTLLTYGLWFGLEILGGIIAVGLELEGFAPYIAALICAGIGGFISRAIVNNADVGDYQTPAEKKAAKALETSRPLADPGEIVITNENAAMNKYCFFYRNNELISGVAPGNSITVTTNQSVNAISALYEKYAPTAADIIVEISDGETKHIGFSNNRFSVKEEKEALTANK